MWCAAWCAAPQSHARSGSLRAKNLAESCQGAVEIGPNCVISALLPPWDRELQYSTEVVRRHTVNTVPSVLRSVVQMRVLALKHFTIKYSSRRAPSSHRGVGVKPFTTRSLLGTLPFTAGQFAIASEG